MMKYLILFIAGIFYANFAFSQNYENILNYNNNENVINGVKIKTNLPFAPASGAPTITIKGYNYGGQEPINLTLVYYIWWTPPSTYFFYASKVSSSGAYTPSILLSNEGGKVVIFINDKGYFQRFTVSVYSQGQSEVESWFQGWTAVDEALTGANTIEVPYRNRFKGEVFMPGNGLWNPSGNVGIGTLDPKERLSVNGKIRAHEIKVETANWPDYVFAKDYRLPSLRETEKHIKEKGHLPGIPSAEEVKANGVNLGEMNTKLLKKIEELTLHLIEQNKQFEKYEAKNAQLERNVGLLVNELEALKKKRQ